MNDLIYRIKHSDKAPGVDEIRIPGEHTHLIYLKRSKSGIPIQPRRMQNMLAISNKLSIQPPM